MSTIKVEVRPGAYYDSVVLMQLQRSLTALPGVLESGVEMGTPANKDLLAQTDMLPAEAKAAAPDDLIIVVRAEDEAAATAALARVNELLTRRKSTTDQEYRPQSLETAAEMLQSLHFVTVQKL